MSDRELEETIDRESRNEREKADSRTLLRTLEERRGQLGGATAIPADDATLTERILHEARSRSEQLRRERSGLPLSGRHEPPSAGIPWWLVALWVAAIAAVIAAWRWLG